MPADLRDLYAALAADADATGLATAAAVRRRGDRHTRTLVAATAVGVSLGIGGVACTANGLLGKPTPTPADSASPQPSASTSDGASPAPSLSASPNTSAKAAPPATAPIPDSAFFTPPANRTKGEVAKPRTGKVEAEPLCNARHPSDTEIGRQRSRNLVYYAVDAPADTIPDGTVDQSITVYKPGGAAEAMDEYRTAVQNCPSEKLDTGATQTYRLLDAPHLGDDALLIERVWTFPPQYPGKVHAYMSIVRIGDAVTLLWVVGWEEYDADLAVTADYTARAVTAIEKWRS